MNQTLSNHPGSPVGGALRSAREQKGLKIEEIADALCIRAIHLRAIESGNYHELPALVYARGFVRSYAEYLKLDHNQILEQFRVETADQEPPKDAVYIPANSNKHMPSKAVIGGTLAGFAVLVLLWGALSRPSGEEPVAAESDNPSASMVVGEEGADAPATGAPQNIFTPSEAAPAPTPAPAAPQASATPAPAPQPAPAAAAEEPAPQVLMYLDALTDSWVEIRDGNDRVLFSRVLRSGEHFPVPAEFRGAVLSTGNAGGITARIGGKTVGALGKPGEVVHDIVLDPRQIMSNAREVQN